MSTRPRHVRTTRLLMVCALAGMIIPTGPAGLADAGAEEPSRSAAAAGPAWKQFRFSPRHLGVNPSETTLTPENVGDLGKAWSEPIPSPMYASAAVVGDLFYVGARNGKLFAADRETGAVDGGRVYVGNEAGDGYALRAENGRKVWRTRLAAGVFAGPAVANGVVYTTTGVGDGKLVALDAADGDVLFSDFVGDGSGNGEWVAADATVADGAIYLGSYQDDSFQTKFELPGGSS